MTPPQVATTQLLPYLPNGHQVVLPGFGHQGTVFREQPEAGSRLINTFFDSGQVDDSLYVPAGIDFTPSMTFGVIAKITLGAMLALAALTVLSLLVNGSPGAHSGPHRAEVRCVAPVGLPARARPGRMVPRRPDRPHDHARRPYRQPAARRPVRRRADRPRHLLGMGASRLFGPQQACRNRRGGRRRTRRRLAGVPRHRRPVGPSSPRLSEPSPAPTSRCWSSTCTGSDPPGISPPHVRRRRMRLALTSRPSQRSGRPDMDRHRIREPDRTIRRHRPAIATRRRDCRSTAARCPC